MFEIIIAGLIFVAVVAVGGAILAVGIAKRRPVEPRLAAVAGVPASAGVGHPETTLSRLGHMVSFGKISASLSERLAQAGFYHSSGPATFLGLKFALLVAGLLASVILVVPAPFPILFKFYIVVMVSGVLFFLPNILLRLRFAERKREVRSNLPTAIDLIEVCVTAGMGLDQAWNAVGDEMRSVSDTLADEMALMNLEIQLGEPRATALRNMAKRTGAEELFSLTALLVQSERFGTGVAEALRTFSESMREHRSMMAEQEAEKTAVKLLFPLVFLIFPVMLVVMVGPAAITLNEIMGS